MPNNPKREDSEVWEKVRAMVDEIAFGQVTLKIQNNKIVLIEKRETEIIK